MELTPSQHIVCAVAHKLEPAWTRPDVAPRRRGADPAVIAFAIHAGGSSSVGTESQEVGVDSSKTQKDKAIEPEVDKERAWVPTDENGAGPGTTRDGTFTDSGMGGRTKDHPADPVGAPPPEKPASKRNAMAIDTSVRRIFEPEGFDNSRYPMVASERALSGATSGERRP